MKKTAYEILTEKVIAALNNGIIPWEKPWFCSGEGAWSHRAGGKGRRYSLLNCLCLSRPGEYVTYTDLTAEGGQLKEGAEADYIFWFSFVQRKDADGNILTDDNGRPLVRPSFKYYKVWHIDDTTLEQRYHTELRDKIANGETLSERACNRKADAIIKAYAEREQLVLKKDGLSDRAYYAPLLDLVRVPRKTQFKDKALYYSTMFHELTHSTGHHSRLDRFDEHDFTNEDMNYSLEELVAEMGAFALLNECKLTTKRSEENSVAYIQSWIKHLKNDPKMLAKAAGRAQKAVDLIMGEADEAEDAE